MKLKQLNLKTNCIEQTSRKLWLTKPFKESSSKAIYAKFDLNIEIAEINFFAIKKARFEEYFRFQ